MDQARQGLKRHCSPCSTGTSSDATGSVACAQEVPSAWIDGASASETSSSFLTRQQNSMSRFTEA